jgi:hypothetical protein
MKSYGSWSTICFLALLVTNVEAGQSPRDFSGDAMQRYESRMPSSPMIRFPGLLGTSYWPFVPYPPAPSMTFVNVVVDIPDTTPAPPPKPPASPRFWFAHCGGFVGMDINATTNLMEEEQKSCQK